MLLKHLKSGLLQMDSWPQYSEKGSILQDSEKLENALAIIIRCTRRLKRPKDIVTLAENISYAEKQLGNIEKVAGRVKLSVQQLKDFLAVENLCSAVRALVRKRTIDSVDIVKTISTLPFEKQKILANHFAKGQFTSKDIRIVTTFAKKFPRKSMKQVISDYEKSKDIRLYVAQFRLPASFNNRDGLYKRFRKIVGKDEIKRLRFKGGVAVLEITSMGYKKLREVLRERQMKLRKFIGYTVSDLGERK